MDDEPLVPPQRAVVPDYPRWEPGYAPIQPSYAYPRGYGPPGSQGPSRLFAAAISGDGTGPSNVLQVPDQPPSKPQPPEQAATKWTATAYSNEVGTTPIPAAAGTT